MHQGIDPLRRYRRALRIAYRGRPADYMSRRGIFRADAARWLAAHNVRWAAECRRNAEMLTPAGWRQLQ